MRHISYLSGFYWLIGFGGLFGIVAVVLALCSARIAAESDERMQEMFWEQDRERTRE